MSPMQTQATGSSQAWGRWKLHGGMVTLGLRVGRPSLGETGEPASRGGGCDVLTYDHNPLCVTATARARSSFWCAFMHFLIGSWFMDRKGP